jgi:hypothetical protein
MALIIFGAVGCKGLDHRGLVSADGSAAGLPPSAGGNVPTGDAGAGSAPADPGAGGNPGGADGSPRSGPDAMAPPVGPPVDAGARPDSGTLARDAAPAVAADASRADDAAATAPPPRDAAGADQALPRDLAPAPTPGLVAHWLLDEGSGTTIADNTGNGNTGTLLNGTSWLTGGAPRARIPNPSALSFDGVDDRVELRARTLPMLGRPMSVSLWFVHDGGSSRGRDLSDLIAFARPEDGAAIQIGFENGFPAVWTWGPRTMIRSGFAAGAGWHHLAYSFDGSTHRLYVDGAQVGNAVRPVPLSAVNHAIMGDFAPSRFTEQFSGRLDDVRVYDRVLSVEEIGDLAGLE